MRCGLTVEGCVIYANGSLSNRLRSLQASIGVRRSPAERAAEASHRGASVCSKKHRMTLSWLSWGMSPQEVGLTTRHVSILAYNHSGATWMNYQHRMALYTKVSKHSYLRPCTYNCFTASTLPISDQKPTHAWRKKCFSGRA